ncbi:phasin family protein [Candidatus Thiosymbion oneisti]|uniref:phasin family protein n=1 Tax=Candidatus Thiosymbion oneisti TaxID=589554 RepID=UPI00105F0FE4|nr:phasin family protein [Candidatus Thiosymbion oneisti]
MNAEKNFDMTKEMGGKAMENVHKLAELNMETLKEIISSQMETVEFVMDQAKRQMELATKVKDFKGLKDLQATVAKETGDRLMDDAKKGMERMSGIRDKYVTFVKEATSSLKSSAN